MWDCGEVLEKLERCEIGRKTSALEISYVQVKRYTWRDRMFFWQREKATPTSNVLSCLRGCTTNIAYWLETHQPTVLLQPLDVPHSLAYSTVHISLLRDRGDCSCVSNHSGGQRVLTACVLSGFSLEI